MKKSKMLKTAGMAAAAVMFTAACASEPENDGGGNNTAAPDNNTNNEAGNEPEEENAEEGDGEAGDLVDGNDLIVGVQSDISSLDPHTTSDVPSGNIQINIFESLTTIDEENELQPNLAESWEDVEDDVWEFELRDDVEFHDGSSFNAEVVQMNIDRIQDEEIASPRAGLFEVIEEVEVVDDYTVRFHTDAPFSALPFHMSTYASNMISPEVIEADYENIEDGNQPGDYVNENPVGTGMFTFNNWEPGSEVVLDRHDDYWNGEVAVDSVTFSVIPEDLTRVGELEDGGAHIIDPVTPSDMDRVEETDGTNIFQTDAASITYMGFNADKEPFDDPLVRRAVSLAVNKENMLEGVLEGTGTPALGPINETQFGYSDNVDTVEQDIEEAQALLEEAGHGDGFETTLWTNDSRERMDVAELVQADLAQIGIDIEIEVVEWGAYLDATEQGEHDMYILGLSLPTMDADYPMHELFHTDSIPTGNRTFWSNETHDDLVQEARVELDEERRVELYEDVVNNLLEESPMSFLYHPDHIMGYRDEISGFWADASGLYQLHDVEINE
ncbi:glutathione ABC transporter substrate-binding protein [Alkalicoccus chagannorensis]|uniref:glutathione ABC transporter substrate-binding protein n=1 Tax=Alkalicoccus chagannorensis TaxID=427072 RepID=UPI00040E8A3C|nr:glutathione ABC transporter substrate-binding protein [Alkalicoccus chagannorensis]